MEKICIVKENVDSYPSKENYFRPANNYPEYLYKDDISETDNPIYEMIRTGLEMMGFDKLNFGSDQWNPLGEVVHPGDCVLVKPNLVLHENINGCGTDCLFTHPSLVAAMVDYIIIALQGKGKIIVGDAPLQECVFETLVEESGYRQLIDYYQRKGVDISLVDFRNVKTYEKDGLYYHQSEEKENGIIVKLDNKSAFSDCDKNRIEKLRITNYDPRILQEHHKENIHEYKVSQYVLDADVIINMPKPKTHRKAGVTIALKNLVGINANKEFLPHHTLGSKKEGGDAYLYENHLLKLANEVLDIKNELMHDNEMDLAAETEKLYWSLHKKGRKQTGEEYWEGSWYGNDTIWRTILDLNRILFYADKNGKMTNTIQRKQFIVGDMIISGEKEGPLEPTPICTGVIVMGDDPLIFDKSVCSLMGFNYRNIPTLYNDKLFEKNYPISNSAEIRIQSNNKDWNKKSIDEIREKYSLKFQPSFGWLAKLGNQYRNQLFNDILQDGNPVYIFGAGSNGIYAAKQLQEQGIKIAAFCDNNQVLWGTEILTGIKCIGLSSTDKYKPFVIAVQDRTVPIIDKQIRENGGKVLGVINK